jgi:hypothetical protein
MTDAKITNISIVKEQQLNLHSEKQLTLEGGGKQTYTNLFVEGIDVQNLI